jgi:thioredoxin-related protein
MKMLAALLLVAGTLAAASPEVKWETSLEAAQTRAKAEHKVIFMDVWTGWCGWCIKLQKETFPSTEAQAALAKVVPLRIMTQESNGSPTKDNYIEKKYQVEAYPMLLILDASGKEISRQAGYLQPQPFASWVNAHAKPK